MDKEIKSNFQGTFAINMYMSIGLSLLWLNHMWDNAFTSFMAAFSIVFIIISYIIADIQHKNVSNK